MKKDTVRDFLQTSERYLRKDSEVAEATTEANLVDYVKALGGRALKLAILGIRGFPDRTILLPGGHIFFIEFKKPGKHLTAGQSKWKALLESFGFRVYVCHSIKEAEKVVDHYIKNIFKNS